MESTYSFVREIRLLHQLKPGFISAGISYSTNEFNWFSLLIFFSAILIFFTFPIVMALTQWEKTIKLFYDEYYKDLFTLRCVIMITEASRIIFFITSAEFHEENMKAFVRSAGDLKLLIRNRRAQQTRRPTVRPVWAFHG